MVDSRRLPDLVFFQIPENFKYERLIPHKSNFVFIQIKSETFFPSQQILLGRDHKCSYDAVFLYIHFTVLEHIQTLYQPPVRAALIFPAAIGLLTDQFYEKFPFLQLFL